MMTTLPNPKPAGPNGPTTPTATVKPALSGHTGVPSQSRDASDPWRGGKAGTATDANVSKGSSGEVKKVDAKDSHKHKGIKDNKGEPKESVISKTALKTPAQKMYPSLKSGD